MSNVTALPGFSVPSPKGEAIPEIVELCEELLRMAKDGDLRALAAAYVIKDTSTAPIFGRRAAWGAGTLGDLLLALGRLQRQLEAEFDA